MFLWVTKWLFWYKATGTCYGLIWRLMRMGWMGELCAVVLKIIGTGVKARQGDKKLTLSKGRFIQKLRKTPLSKQSITNKQ
ncbi:MAG: hypothetical protein C0593_07980 [Marinilabiliales bacterium]|nr:MAG: hypothetical protein C0593_07980 [Marinilabiliales bacterium]